MAWLIFAATLLGVALFHKHTLPIAIAGLIATIGFNTFFNIGSVLTSLTHETSLLLNLLGLLLGFEILAHYLKDTKIPQILPKFLPDDWKGPLVLLIIAALLASVIDHIAASLIAGSIAYVVFNKKVHIGYIAAIVGASNIGGTGSVLGNITTTMMWLGGIPISQLFQAYIGAFVAFAIFAPIAAIQQHRYHPIIKDEIGHHHLHYKPLIAVTMIVIGAILGNILIGWPAIGVWAAIILSQFFAKTPFGSLKASLPNALFLLCLVSIASLMPLNALPIPTVWTTFALGWVSAIFDNIPLTKLAISQGGYNWGLLSYCVGFGGSMIWFGSSAGVAIVSLFPQARSTLAWIKGAWHLPLAYSIGFVVHLLFSICY